MRRKLLVSLLVTSVASLALGAVWQPVAQETALQVTFDDDPECPDLTDPNAPLNRYACELGARIEYELGLITCSEYVDKWLDCHG